MNHKAVEYTLLQVAADRWRWRFQIGETVVTGKTSPGGDRSTDGMNVSAAGRA